MPDELRDKLAKAFYRQYKIYYMGYSPDSPHLHEELDRRWGNSSKQFEYLMADVAIEVFYEKSRKE